VFAGSLAGAFDVAQIRPAGGIDRRRNRDHHVLRLAHRGWVVGEGDLTVLDASVADLTGRIDAAIERVDDLPGDVETGHVVASPVERYRQWQADVPHPNDTDIRAHSSQWLLVGKPCLAKSLYACYPTP
jgi:hypothetical protein